MKRSLVAVILLCLITQVSKTQELWKQKRYEAIVGIGTSQFFGDIGGFTKTENILGLKDISFKQTRFNINVALNYRILKQVSAKLSLTYGMFHATDERGSNEARSLEARTSFFEPALIGEYFFIKSEKENSYLFGKGRRTKFRTIMSSLDIYAFTGIGGLSYNVKGNEKLKAFGMKTSGFTAVIPAGIGLNLLIMPEYNFGLELGGRYAFSDYLDGYSSQYSRSNDVYYFFNFTFTYKIRTGRNGLPAFLNKRRF
jgi:hypothetical protein